MITGLPTIGDAAKLTVVNNTMGVVNMAPSNKVMIDLLPTVPSGFSAVQHTKFEIRQLQRDGESWLPDDPAGW